MTFTSLTIELIERAGATHGWCLAGRRYDKDIFKMARRLDSSLGIDHRFARTSRKMEESIHSRCVANNLQFALQLIETPTCSSGKTGIILYSADYQCSSPELGGVE